MLFVPRNTKQIRPAHKSKYNHKRDNQVILLIITDGENNTTLSKANLILAEERSVLKGFLKSFKIMEWK